MGAVCNKEPILEKREDYFSCFGFIFDRFFNSKSHKINAMIILEKIKEKDINPSELKKFICSLPKGRWTINTISERVVDINNLFGLNNEEIIKHCVNEVSKKDIENIKWEILVQSTLESSKYANEYFDALKYNCDPKLSRTKMRLLNELMMVFKYIKECSNKLYDKYESARYSNRNLINFNTLRFPVDLLWLRILYLLFNLKDASNNKIEDLTKTLAMERISLSHQKVVLPRFN